MYGFRKPFTAAGYGGAGAKAWLVTAQVMGYMVSKFIGIKVIAEMAAAGRARALLGLIGIAHAVLLVFAVVPAPVDAVCLFVNGLALGMVFGLVLGFVEGRCMTEVFVAGLCASFILADGVSKSAGSLLLQRGQEQGHCSSNIWLAHVLLNSQCTAIRKGMEHSFRRAFVFLARLSRRAPLSVGRGCIGNRSGVFGLSGAWPCAATFAAARIAKFIHVRSSRCFLQGVAYIDATFFSGQRGNTSV
jgi:hypothetical protein